jgi:hypothetical protein
VFAFDGSKMMMLMIAYVHYCVRYCVLLTVGQFFLLSCDHLLSPCGRVCDKWGGRCLVQSMPILWQRSSCAFVLYFHPV